jgi:hypothetical protein
VIPTSAQAARPRWDTDTAGPQVNLTDILPADLAAALFASSLPACSRPVGTEVAAAIRDALRAYGGTRGCAGEVAAAYGEHPESAAPRMCWARQVVQDAFPRCANRRRKPPQAGRRSHRARSGEPGR